MNIISTKAHAILDYALVLLLFLSPRLFKLMDYSDTNPAVWIVPSSIAVLIASSAVMTDYEGGLFRWLPMQFHLYADLALGFILAISPWLFGFADFAFFPHLIIGVVIIITSMLTKKRTVYSVAREPREPFIYKSEKL